MCFTLAEDLAVSATPDGVKRAHGRAGLCFPMVFITFQEAGENGGTVKHVEAYQVTALGPSAC